VLGNAEHIEEFDGILVDIRENNLCAFISGVIDDVQQNRDADTVDDLGFEKFTTSFLQPASIRRLHSYSMYSPLNFFR